jgi:hypothetical protein
MLALSGRSNVMAPAVLGKPYYRKLRDEERLELHPDMSKSHTEEVFIVFAIS